jgi:hypothetical protein
MKVVRASRLNRARSAAGLAALLLIALAVTTGAVSAQATGRPSAVAAQPTPSDCSTDATGATTCRNNGPFANAWNPVAGNLAPVPREVTVSQTTDLRSQVVNVSWKNFSPSGGATFTRDTTPYKVWVFECQTAAPTSLDQCFGSLGYQGGRGALPSDTNYVQTLTTGDGTQSIQFGVLSKTDEPSLACDADTQCSLLIIPWSGGVQPASCNDHSQDASLFSANSAYGTFGSLSRNTCAWYSRIVVPLSFAQTPENCGSADPQFTAEGSQVDSRAMELWRSGLCSGANPLSIGYVGLSESLARGDVGAGKADLALTTRPEDAPARPVTYAPVTNTAVVVSYYLDDPTTGRPVTAPLRLNARLLAKMLTQSYSPLINNLGCDDPGRTRPCAPEVSGNPASLFEDPEFTKLNPTLTNVPALQTNGQPFPSVVFGDNDATYELTRWIAADPAAAAFLSGQPDEWQMKINSAYLPENVGALYPTGIFTSIDPGTTLKTGAGNCDLGENCLSQGLQMTWNPINGLDNVAKQLLFFKDSGRSYEASCGVATRQCDTHPTNPKGLLGNRAYFAVTSAADAAAYQFPTAQLMTAAGSFVGPSATAVGAGVAALAPGAQVASLDHATAPAGAYPVTMPTYAMLPTCGLTTAKISAIGSFLTYVVSDAGQRSGTGAGDLAPGYAPLTSAQRAATTAAIGKLSATPCPVPDDGGDQAFVSDDSAGDGSGDAPSGPGADPGTAGPTDGASPAGEPGPAATGDRSLVTAAATAPIEAGLLRLVIPVLFLAGLVLLLGVGPAFWFVGSGRSLPISAAVRWIRRAP